MPALGANMAEKRAISTLKDSNLKEFFKAVLFGTASAFLPGPEREGSGKTAAVSGEHLPLAQA
jgi:hypothetical protein